MPSSWESRVALYVAYLFTKGAQSATVKSYISAIKSFLLEDGYEWQQKTFLFSALTKSCKLHNDTVRTRLPIQKDLLNILLDEIEEWAYENNQAFLEVMYKSMLAVGYYGLLRISELAGCHAIKAKDVHIAENKDKILLVLYTSKTHGYNSNPQLIKIEADGTSTRGTDRTHSPFNIVQGYSNIRGGYMNDEDHYFIFRDGNPVTPGHFRKILKLMIRRVGLNHKIYDTHSLRIGRATDLSKLGFSVDQIKFLGRWKSNAVYKYIRKE